jgi:DNA repair protein RadC
LSLPIRFWRLFARSLIRRSRAVLFPDAKNHLIQSVKIFRGTIDSASAYPREVVKEALRLNAATVIFEENARMKKAPQKTLTH